MASSTVLIVDDEATIRTSVRLCLENAGYRVLEANDGDEAMARILRDAPDLMLLDLAMPVTDGMKVLAQMRSLWARYPTRVVVVTAHGSIRTAIQAMQLGASDYLEKPFTPEDLRLSVASVLQARDPADFLEKPSTPQQIGLSVGAVLKEQHGRPAAAQSAAPPQRPSYANVGYSQTLVRLQQAVWKSDINLTERTLADCLRRARSDPTFFNVVGVVFEAQGNLQTAKTFYEKAQAIPGGYEPASQNLTRLLEIEKAGAAQCDVALGTHAQFINDLYDGPTL